MHKNVTPELLVLIAASLWGTGGLAIHFANLPAGVISFFRMAIPSVVLAGWFLIRRYRPSRDGLPLKLLASGINAVRMYFFFLAYQLTTIANAVVALYTWPIFAAIFARLILGERITGKRGLLLSLAFVGIPLLYIRAIVSHVPNEGVDDLLGISSMLLSAALHALTIVILKRARPGNSPFESTFFQNAVGALVFFPVFLLSDVRLEPVQMAMGVYLGLVVGLLGFTFFFVGLHASSAARAGNLAYFEVVVAVTLSVLVLQEPPHWNTVVGGLLITVSVILSQRISRQEVAVTG